MPPRGRRKKDEGPAGPDPLLLAEERLAQVFSHIAKRIMETAPDPNDPKAVPLTALDALCEMHADYKEQAQYRRLALDEAQLKEAINAAKAEKEAMVKGRRKKDPRKKGKESEGEEMEAPDA
eukprot:TRINITY_DN20971_c0_g1_i1.p1 TRINITY_DN20971_c0_g1~~TRINITY_DN20971_c0_g1_i1.p1  ORF type:complete len:122 (-),score=59.04 TRINITY_DN20971_c0_g1_i1:409-774(-)